MTSHLLALNDIYQSLSHSCNCRGLPVGWEHLLGSLSPVQETVVGKEAYCLRYFKRQVVDVDEEQQGS